jgi:ABC-type nickel/cobalt efflux system permease component RcnA
MSFGYYRSEILGALLSTIVIWILTGVLVYLAVLRVIDQTFDIEPIAMVVTASCGVFFNIVMYFILHTDRCFKGIDLKHHGHSHSGDNHGHSHSSDNHGHSHSNNGHGHSHESGNNNRKHSHDLPIDGMLFLLIIISIN